MNVECAIKKHYFFIFSELEADFDQELDLDDSVNDPDFEPRDSDVESSDEFDDNNQSQGNDCKLYFGFI